MIKEDILILPDNRTTVIYMAGDITEAKDYIEVYKILRLAKEGDIIELEINTNGGSCYTTNSIITNILRSKAKVISNIQIAISSGAILALACDEIRVLPMAKMMIHQVSWNHTGSITNGKDQYKFAVDHYNKADKIIYQGFLTEKEILDEQKGKELWFNEKDIKKRLKSFIPLRKRLKI